MGTAENFNLNQLEIGDLIFYIVKLNLLIEIAGSSWSVGCGGKKIANAFNKYDLAENMGYTFVRLEPHQIESVAQSIGFKGSLERLEDGTDQTISIDGSN